MNWYVYVEDVNARQIVKYDVFSHVSFLVDATSAYKNHKDDFKAFSKALKDCLRYYFWGQCEWEVILSAWPPSPKFKESKISVYDQVMLNYDVFAQRVWDYLGTITKGKK